jgi:hypothetical protein
MSTDAINIVWTHAAQAPAVGLRKQQVVITRLEVLLALAERADADNRVQISIPALSQIVGRSRETTCLHLRALEQAGFLKVHRRTPLFDPKNPLWKVAGTMFGEDAYTWNGEMLSVLSGAATYHLAGRANVYEIVAIKP